MAQDVQNSAGAGDGSKADAVVAFTPAKPWLVVEAPKAIDAVQFYKEAFAAEELHRALHQMIKPYLDGEISDGEGAWGGVRVGKVKDPYGNVWVICTPAEKFEDVEPVEP